jgi:tight adherence protein B
MGMMEIAAGVCILLTFVTLAMLLSSFIAGGQTTKVKSRVERLTKLPEQLQAEIENAQRKKSLISRVDLRPMLARFTGESYFLSVERELAQSDIRLRVSEFLIVRGLVVIFGVLVAIILLKSLLLGILCGIPLLFIHIPFLGFRRAGRLKKFNNQLAEFLILIVNSLRAGQTFMQGCSIAAAETPHPISTEFKQVIKEVNLGMPEAEALENMLTRVPSQDLEIVISGYIIQRRVGGNLAQILETTAATIRERIKIQGLINTLTTQGKLSGAIVALLPFGIGLAISGINPSYMKPLFTPPWGYALIGIALFMQAIGAFVISRIVKIEV